MKIDVVYQFNEKYAPFAGVSITSMCENNKHFEDICFYILGEELSEDSIFKLKKSVEKYKRKIVFVCTDNLINMMLEWDMPKYRNSYAANMRLFLSYVLLPKIKRVLYLDADTIVVGKLDELLDIDMQGKALGMVLDSIGEKHKFDIGLSEGDFYYNSGVILFDMDEWKRQQFSEKIAYYIKNVRAHYSSPDQDLLNVVCRDSILTLKPKFNLQSIHKAFSVSGYMKTFPSRCYFSQQELCEAINDPAIVHFFRFIGEFPWNSKNVHPYNYIFDEYLLKSEWRNYKKEPAKVGLAIKVEKILYILLPAKLFFRIFKIAHQKFIKQANALSIKKVTDKRM